MPYCKTLIWNKPATAFFITALTIINPAFAANFDVNNTGDANDINPGNGICETAVDNAVCTLRAAISEANALSGADIINLPAGTYTIQSSAAYNNTSGSLFITDALTLAGENAATTIIDADQQDRAMVILATGNVAISNVTIENGYVGTSGYGGGILLGGDSLIATISNTVIRNNSANTGAGISWSSPVDTVTLENCLIENNEGISDINSSTSTGGGISTSSGSLIVMNSTIRNNTSQFGGGIFTIGRATLINSTVSGNTATNPQNSNGGFGGGGIHVGSGSSGTLITINSTISGNKSLSSGAGILMVNGTATLYNSTVTGNIADFNNDGFGYGGGITGSSSSPQPSIELINSIVAGNQANAGDGPDCWGSNLAITSYGYNLIGNSTGCTITQSTGDIFGTVSNPIDPMLDALADNGGSTQTHALKPNSPAIDAGNPTDCTNNTGATLSTDQRGSNRHFDGGSGSARCDIGAYEINYALAANAGVDQAVNINATVNLNAGNSQASRGIASYAWIEVGGATVTLNNANTATPDFAAPSTAATLIFELTIVDNNGAISTDTITVTVTNNAPPPATSSGGSFDLWTGLLMIFLVSYYRQRKQDK